jgi:hypothetical protein
MGGISSMEDAEFYGPWCMFGCISVVVVEGAWVRDCRGLGLCTISTVG